MGYGGLIAVDVRATAGPPPPQISNSPALRCRFWRGNFPITTAPAHHDYDILFVLASPARDFYILPQSCLQPLPRDANMHILVTNDDGPPSPTSSPYVHSLVRALQRAGHVVSVCLPHTQRSWIGKAHMIGETVKPTYYRPSATFDPTPRSDSDSPSPASHGTTHARPVKSSGVEEWILVDGTPASCAQIGLHHFFAEKGPIDLVVSGPNYGRNTTAVFALSSGTLGGALEAAVCKKKAIALSYAFFSRNHDPTIIEGASAHSVKVIESLYKQWPGDGSVDVYTVNVPLVEGVGEHKTIFTAMLQNYWGSGSCFQEVEGSVGDEGEEESRIREGERQSEIRPAAGGRDDSTGYPHRHFKWAPRFTDVYQSVENAPPGNDGWAVKEGLTRFVTGAPGQIFPWRHPKD